MATQLVSSGGKLAAYGGQLLFYRPITVGMLAGKGTLSAHVVSLRQNIALSGHGALTPTAWFLPYRYPTPNGHGALAVTAKSKKFVFTATTSGHGALTGTAIIIKAVLTVHLSGQGTLANEATSLVPLPGRGVLTATAYAKFNVAATLSGHGVLAVTAKPKLAAALAGNGSLTATAKPKLAAALSGHGVLTATANAKSRQTSGNIQVAVTRAATH